MFGEKTIRITQKAFDTMLSTMKRDADNRISAEARAEKYHEECIVLYEKNIELTRENDRFRILFDKEADTQIIKYNEKLYRIASTCHTKEIDGSEVLNIDAVCVGEVN